MKATSPREFAELPEAELAGFEPGTWIATPGGYVPVEDLAAGALVSVLGGGSVPIRRVLRAGASRRARSRRVRIRAGALGRGPAAELVIEARASVRVVDLRGLGLFGQMDFLVAAEVLVDGEGVREEAEAEAPALIRLDLGASEIICANGLWTVSAPGRPVWPVPAGPDAAAPIYLSSREYQALSAF